MKRWISLTAITIVVGFNLAVGFAVHADEDNEGSSASALQRVFTDRGVTYIKLDTNTQKAIGLQTRVLKPALYRASIRAYGQVMGLSNLLNSYRQLVNAQAKIYQSRTQLDASQAEYRRLNGLYRHQQNVSTKAVQMARATWQFDQASVRSAKAQKFAVISETQARWGTLITQWMTQDSRYFRSLADGQSRLLELTLPLGIAPANPPRTAQVLLANGTKVAVSLIASALTAEPDLQGQSYYFLAASQVRYLTYGLHVVGLMPYGSQYTGVVIPDAAIVWFQGSAWAYVKAGIGRFERKPVRTTTPVPGGWFQVEGFNPSSQIVTHSAEVLLSIEVFAGAPKGTAGEDGDGD